MAANTRERLLRPATRSDAARLFEMVNLPDSLAQKLHTTAPVDWNTHLAWVDRRLSDPGTMLFMIECDEHVVGQVRLQQAADGAPEIDIYVAEPHRGTGIARRAIMQAVKRWTLLNNGEC